jgi:hypothetical protein
MRSATTKAQYRKPQKGPEKQYDFTLILTGIADADTKVAEALFVAGCDDATLSQRSGVVYLSFSRVASSYKDAILSAIQDVRSARVGADVLRVDEWNLVTAAEIARKIGRSRQLVHQYVTGARGPGDFPPPVCRIRGSRPLWAWCDVAHWLRQNHFVGHEVHQDAVEVSLINTILEWNFQRKTDPKLADGILNALKA